MKEQPGTFAAVQDIQNIMPGLVCIHNQLKQRTNAPFFVLITVRRASFLYLQAQCRGLFYDLLLESGLLFHASCSIFRNVVRCTLAWECLNLPCLRRIQESMSLIRWVQGNPSKGKMVHAWACRTSFTVSMYLGPTRENRSTHQDQSKILNSTRLALIFPHFRWCFVWE